MSLYTLGLTIETLVENNNVHELDTSVLFGLTDRVNRAIKQMLNRPIVIQPSLPSFKSYSKFMKMVDMEFSVSRLMAAIRYIDEEEKQAIIMDVNQIIEYWRAQKPQNSRQTVTGVHVLEPSIAEKMRFLAISNMIIHPLSILEQLQSGLIHSDQINTLSSCYPEFYQMITESLYEALAILGDVYLNPTVTRNVSVLLGHSLVSSPMSAPVSNISEPVAPKTDISMARLSADDLNKHAINSPN